MNKKGQAVMYVRFLASLFFSLVIFLILRKPVIEPMIDTAIGAVTDPFAKVILKLIPITILFFFCLTIFSLFRRGTS